MELVQLDTLCQDLRDLQGIVQVLKDDISFLAHSQKIKCSKKGNAFFFATQS